MAKPSVLVLMCTYNGEKYVAEQIESILAQKDVDVFIKAADDCSTDSTADILRRFKERYSNFDYYINESNKGFTYNFLDLLFSVRGSGYDYYAFSDQDDFWLDEKLIRAVEMLGGSGVRGKLYCSNLRLADSNLKQFDVQYDESFLKLDKYNFIVSNLAAGCTTVFDKKFLAHATTYYPENIRLHDYWLFLIAVYTAEYVFDMNSYILYRQHLGNQLGTSKRLTLSVYFKRFFKRDNSNIRLFDQLLAGYSQYISEEDREILAVVRDYKKKFSCKMKLLFSRKVRRFKNNFIFRFSVLLNRF